MPCCVPLQSGTPSHSGGRDGAADVGDGNVGEPPSPTQLVWHIGNASCIAPWHPLSLGDDNDNIADDSMIGGKIKATFKINSGWQ